jgi:hypothetical protein
MKNFLLTDFLCFAKACFAQHPAARTAETQTVQSVFALNKHMVTLLINE